MKIFYDDVFRALNKNKVRYAVAGGVAVVLYGYPRFTADLDLIVQLEENNIEKFFDTLNKLGYRPKVPVTKEQFKDKHQREAWIKNKGMIVLSFYHLKEHLKHIDVFVKEPIKFNLIERKMNRIKVKDLEIPVLSIEHLKRLKKAAGRPQDTIDLANLEAIKKSYDSKKD